MKAEKVLTVVPAYQRTYGSREEIENSYRSGHDFQIVGMSQWAGSYINKEDAERFGVEYLRVRYRYRNRKVHTIKVQDYERS